MYLMSDFTGFAEGFDGFICAEQQQARIKIMTPLATWYFVIMRKMLRRVILRWRAQLCLLAQISPVRG